MVSGVFLGAASEILVWGLIGTYAKVFSHCPGRRYFSDENCGAFIWKLSTHVGAVEENVSFELAYSTMSIFSMR